MTNQTAVKHRLLLTNIFPPAIGGPATFMSYLAQYLASVGDNVTVVCSTESRYKHGSVPLAIESNPAVSITRFNLDSRYRYEVLIRLRLAYEFTRHRVALINGLDNYALPIAGVLGRRCIVKVVGDSVWERARNHGFTTVDIDQFQKISAAPGEFFAGRRSQTALLSKAACVVTPSTYLKTMVAGWGISPERIRVISNSYSPELDSWNETQQPQAPSAGSPLRLLFVGRLTNWKGIETALIALREFASHEVTLTVCGDGPLYPTALSIARQLGVAERVNFLGRVAHKDVLAALQTHHALVLTSLYEGLSHTLLDALAVGLPVIASACGGNIELVTDRQNGLLIPPESPAALVAAVHELQKSERWKAIATAAREKGLTYSQKQVADQYRVLLDEVECNNHSRVI